VKYGLIELKMPHWAILLINIFIMSLKLGGDIDVSFGRSAGSKSSLVGSLWSRIDSCSDYGYNAYTPK
jgi:hypothetical protein